MHDSSKLEDFDSEEQRSNYLVAIRQSIQDNGKFTGDILSLIDILSQVLCDQYPLNRKLAMDMLCELIPSYEGDDLDSNIGLLFPQLLQNLLHHQLTIKKSVLQVLHLYFRHTKNTSQAVDHLIVHGIHNDVKSVRNEVLVSLPALTSNGFESNHIEKLILSILNCLNSIDNGESILPISLSLEHLKNTMGEDDFAMFMEKLDPSLVHVYQKATKNSTYTWHQNANHHKPMTRRNSTNLSEFLPMEILENLAPEKSWQIRSDAVNDLATYISITMDSNSLKFHCRRILEYMSVLADDSNFNVALVSMNILHQIVMKAGDQSKVHLDIIIKILLKKLGDTNLIMRKINLRIALSLMHALAPSVFLKSIFPLLKHKSSRVREQIINMIIAALLSFPSSDFDLVTLPELIGFTLMDSQKRVRHASLECFAILAQQLGPGNLSPLVSAVDILERKNKSADGLLLAVQSRLRRKVLPKINENEVVQYAVKLPASRAMDGQLKPDVAWIMKDCNSHSGYRTSRSEMSDYEHGEKRILSAGRNKLPWEHYDEDRNARKSTGSAPVGMKKDHSPDPSAVICDSWVGDENHKQNSKSDMPGTYFELYKNRMKKLKEAGLRADVQTVNMDVSTAEKQRRDSLDEDSMSDYEPKTSPVPVKPTLARSASKKRLDRMSEKKPDSLALKNTLNDSNLAHTLPKMKGGLLHMISPTFNSPSPFPSRPTLHRAPSGTSSNRQSPRNHQSSESSNLARLKELSKSSPEVIDRIAAGGNFQYHADFYRGETTHQEEMPHSMRKHMSDISYNRDIFTDRNEYSADSNTSSDDKYEIQQPGTPKLAKSAQEKLRKLKEEQQRQSANKYREPLQLDHHHQQQGYNKVNIEFDENQILNHSSPVHEKRKTNKGKTKRRSLSDSTEVQNFHGLKETTQSSPRNNENRLAKVSSPPINPDDRPIKPSQNSGYLYGMDDIISKPQTMSNPDDRPIKPSKQNWSDRNGNIPDENRNHQISDQSNESDILMVEGHRQKVQKVQPKYGASPKLKRKSTRKAMESEILDNTKENAVEKKPNHSNSADIDLDSIKPFDAVAMATNMLNSNAEDWEMKNDGLALMRRILLRHREFMPEFNATLPYILAEVKNLRSQVTRNAINCIADVFVYTPKQVETELESVLTTVLPKAADTNQFIRSDTEQAIEALVEHVNPFKAIPALITCGASHRNGNVRKVTSKAIADFVQKIGYVKFCQQKSNMVTAAKLASDQHPETRYHGRRILLLLLDQPDLLETLKKQLNAANFKAVTDIVENLKTRGLEPASGSATLRKSTRGSAPYLPHSTRSKTRR